MNPGLKPHPLTSILKDLFDMAQGVQELSEKFIVSGPSFTGTNKASVIVYYTVFITLILLKVGSSIHVARNVTTALSNIKFTKLE